MYGNQRTKPNVTSNKTTDPLVSPITAEELANSLGIEYDPVDDAILNGCLYSACNYFIKHMNHELLARDYTLSFDRYPADGESYSGLGRVGEKLKWWIDTPMTPTTDVAQVLFSGDVTAFTTDLNSVPQRIFTDTRYADGITITYTAGYPTVADIPQNIMFGLYAMAGYLYEHYGACNVDNAAKNSGAIGVWSDAAMILSL